MVCLIAEKMKKKQINALFLTRDSDLDTIDKDCRLKVLNGDIQACGERFNEARIICDKKIIFGHQIIAQSKNSEELLELFLKIS